MPFLLALLWLLHNLVFVSTLAVLSPAGASASVSFTSSPLATGVTVPHSAPNNVTLAPNFRFRVPFSTIELHVVCFNPVDSHDLAITLLRIHQYIDDYIIEHGEGPLAPKDDPFGWQKSSEAPSVSFEARSMAGQLMTWSVLQIAVDGLYMCLFQAGWNNEAVFTISDYQSGVQWGFGQLTTGPLLPLGNQSLIALPNGNGTSLHNITDDSRSASVATA